MRIALIVSSLLLLFLGVFSSSLSHPPVEIKTGVTKLDERNASYVNGQNHLSIKQIDSLTAFSNKNLSLALMSK
jgi:hypothetical protein